MPLIIKMSGKLCDKSGEIGLPNLVKTQQTGVSVSEMYNNNDMQNYSELRQNGPVQIADEKKGSNAATHGAYPPINTKSTGNNLGHNLLSSTAISKRPSSAMPTMKETTPQ